MKTTIKKFNPVTAMNPILRKLKTISAIGAAAALLCVGGLTAHAADPGTKTLHGHVPAIVSQLKAKGELPSGTTLNLAIGLPLQNTNELADLLQQIYDPSSPNYHHYLTPEEFTEKFGPTKEQYQMVANFARVNGLTVIATHPNRMLLGVSGKASDVQKAFNVKLKVYQHPTENRDFFAPDTEPTINPSLPVLDINGLNNYIVPHPALVRRSVAGSSAIPSADGSGLFGSYAGNDFRTAYVPGTTLIGSGQAVALFELDGYYSTDITAYEAQTGLTNVPLQNVLVDGFSGVPSFNNGEVALDIEVAVAMAPGLSKVIVYEAPNALASVADLLNRIATDNQAKQISSSWLIGDNASWEQIYQEMAIQGQSFFQASGDNDAYNWSVFGQQRADDPYITLVGGTTLTMNGSAVSYASETVWNWDVEFGPAADGFGSGGGISPNYTIPTWQTNINMTARQGSSTMRNVPDVALTADNIYIIADNGQQEIIGGTSAATPLWAAFTALVNQQATNNGHAYVGFLNPALYSIAASANYTNCFHDITTGNNEWSQSPTLFVATNNYDLCTGLGTPTGTNLINALTSVGVTNPITHLSPPQPPYGSTLSTLNGGNPNGTWELFVLDDATFNSGMISNGWVLTLTTANPVGFSADNALAMIVSATNIAVGGTVIYTLTVTNYGPSVSSNVLVSDTLPLNSVILTDNADQGSVTRAGQSLNWNVGTLVTNAGSKMVFTAQLNNIGSILNYATASAGTPDANSDNDFAYATVTVINPIPPQFSSIVANTNGTFQLTISQPPLPTIIQASTNLVTWTSIYTNTPPFTFTDSNAVSYPNRFYRAVTP